MGRQRAEYAPGVFIRASVDIGAVASRAVGRQIGVIEAQSLHLGCDAEQSGAAVGLAGAESGGEAVVGIVDAVTSGRIVVSHVFPQPFAHDRVVGYSSVVGDDAARYGGYTGRFYRGCDLLYETVGRCVGILRTQRRVTAPLYVEIAMQPAAL